MLLLKGRRPWELFHACDVAARYRGPPQWLPLLLLVNTIIRNVACSRRCLTGAVAICPYIPASTPRRRPSTPALKVDTFCYIGRSQFLTTLVARFLAPSLQDVIRLFDLRWPLIVYLPRFTM